MALSKDLKILARQKTGKKPKKSKSGGDGYTKAILERGAKALSNTKPPADKKTVRYEIRKVICYDVVKFETSPYASSFEPVARFAAKKTARKTIRLLAKRDGGTITEKDDTELSG